ncbi:hypothetical protein J7E50_12755 [Pedobacter sp. ISL-68]|uniref:hypothetical protein n=1 Tax=unclassified Pedobacter TaxID=2628915 RepID=UPI001BE4F753|nr:MULTISPECIES: hypothetical protein [unclassified Pedobacter]MBT2561707.1 hypothetical protein [Pedobacter sp. ISL-64]MBT2591095.1 hypothetical protein [Pedobacter sp. ISL-68]
MKNLHKLALGLLVGASAIGFSAFTSTSEVAVGDRYGNNGAAGTTGQYNILANPYVSSNCISGSDRCAYVVTAAGASTVTGSSYSEAQLETWASQGTPFVTRSTEIGTYTGF